MYQLTKTFICLFVSISLLLSCQKSNEPIADDQAIECQTSNAVALGDRLIGLDLLNTNESNDFDHNIALAKELNIDFIALHTTWSGLESIPNVYGDPFEALSLLGQIAKENGFQFSLTIRPIDATGKTVPTDLETQRFNNPQIIDRFKSLVDFIFTKVEPSVLLSLQIGNEIDLYDTSNEHAEFWSDYGQFLWEAKQHIVQHYPSVKTGFTCTYHGLMTNTAIFKSLQEAVDILGVTYYPLTAAFDVKSPDAIHEDLNNLVSEFTTKPIFLQEVGYQSSAVNNSSEQKQATFFCHFFEAWDNHRDRIKTANIVRLNDLSEDEAVTSAGPYGISSPAFISYLRTLGIRTYDGDGTNKKTFETIRANIKARK